MTLVKKKLLLLAAAFLPSLILSAAWFIHRWHKLFDSLPYFIGAVGNLFACIAFPLLAVMLFLGIRFSAAEKVFGLDRLLRFHKSLATVVVALLTSHAALRFLKISLLSPEGFQWNFLFSLSTGSTEEWGMNLARIALILLVAAAGIARMGSLAPLPFNLWKRPHFLLYAAVPAGLLHAQAVGDDMSRFPYVAVWIVALVLFLWAVIYRVAYVAKRERNGSAALTRTVSENSNVKTLQLDLVHLPSSFSERQPGQFGVIRVGRGKTWSEPRPFTIANAPDAQKLCFTVKKAGRYTAGLHALGPGTKILCEGPYGIFTPDFGTEKNIVMIAGGVGITPFLSIIRHCDTESIDAALTLLWACKTRRDLFAEEELQRLAGAGKLKVVCVLSRETGKQQAAGNITYDYGRIHPDTLTRHITPQASSWYLCGPAPMQRFVLQNIKQAFGVSPAKVKRELFFW